MGELARAWIGQALVGTAGSGHAGSGFWGPHSGCQGLCKGSGLVSTLGLLLLRPTFCYRIVLLVSEPVLRGLWPLGGDDRTLDCHLRFLGFGIRIAVPLGELSLCAPEWTCELSRSACEIHGLVTSSCLLVCFCCCNLKGNTFSKIIACIWKVILTLSF